MTKCFWQLLLVTTPTFARASDGDAQAATPAQFGAADLLGVGSSTVAVLAVILLLAWIYKRSQRYRGAAGDVINVLAVQSLGPKERILLVEVAGEQLVLGMTASQVQTLHVLVQPIVTKRDQSRSAGFAARLANALREATR